MSYDLKDRMNTTPYNILQTHTMPKSAYQKNNQNIKILSGLAPSVFRLAEIYKYSVNQLVNDICHLLQKSAIVPAK